MIYSKIHWNENVISNGCVHASDFSMAAMESIAMIDLIEHTCTDSNVVYDGFVDDNVARIPTSHSLRLSFLDIFEDILRINPFVSTTTVDHLVERRSLDEDREIRKDVYLYE